MKQVVFVHNPRTAGSTMESWVKRHIRDRQVLQTRNKRIQFDPSVSWTLLYHNTVEDLIDAGVFDWDWYRSCFSFVFVRNTWDRLVSLFEWRRTRKYMGMQKYAAIQKCYASFEAYIRAIESGELEKLQDHIGLSQLLWADCNFSFIGRFENLQQDWKTICDLTGVTHSPLIRTVRKAPSRKADYRDYYTPKLRRMVARCFAEEIERFDFKFD